MANMSPSTLALGVKLSKMVKKHIRNKTTPTQADLIALGKLCGKEVVNAKDASHALLNEGLSTLAGTGMMPENDITKLLQTITAEAPNHENFGDFAESLIVSLPVPDEAKILAAALIGGD